jgi:hypothetical protein
MNDRQAELFKASVIRSSLDDLDQDECDGRITVRQIAKVIGDEAAHKLARDFGGTRLYVPSDPCESHPLTLSVGREDALAIAAKFAGEELVIPMYKSRARRRYERDLIVKLRQRHRSFAAIARQVGCSERHVYKVLAEIGR